MDLNGVEIFRAGIWNGDSYSVADLDAMVVAFNRVGFRPPVKLGHEERSGGPAYGWVQQLRRVDDKLVADLTDLSRELYEAIKRRAYDAVSCEVFFDLNRNGQRFSRVLKAIALLGAETPAVSGLAPLRAALP